MTHISRPFQIFLVAFVLFVAVWFVALRDHTSSTTGAGSSVPAPAPVKTSPAKPATTSTHATVVQTTTTKPGSLTVVRKTTTTKPGSATVSHTTTVTHTTVAKRSAATGRTAAASTKPSTTHGAVLATAKPSAEKSSAAKPHSRTPAPVKPAPKVAAKPAPSTTKPAAGAAKQAAGTPAMQVAVEHQLQQGKTVLILFWSPNGYDDAVVHRELPAVERSSRGSVVVHYASAKQVGEYGAITDAVQVNQTPTLLIVEPHGQTTTITGLTEAFAIDQAIAEARAAAAKTAAK